MINFLSSNFIFFWIIILEQYYFIFYTLPKNWPSTKSAIKNLPSGSTSFAIFNASELAKSEFAGDTANIRQFGLVINCINMLLISISISAGWSPTGTFVMPGRSTRVKFSTKIYIKKNLLVRYWALLKSCCIFNAWFISSFQRVCFYCF